MWTPIPRPQTSVDACEATLREAILGGRIAAGERLPPERVLAEELGVNRVTVRSALARLQVAGLIAIRQGSGARVQPWQESAGPDVLGSLAAMEDSRAERARIGAELLAVRRHLAHAVLEHLGESAPPLETSGFEAALEAFEKAAETGTTAAVARADLDVVRALLAVTRSPVLQVVMNPIGDVVLRFDDLRDALYRAPDRNLLGWQGLLAWMRTPDPAMIPHLLEEMKRADLETIAHLKGDGGQP